MVKLIGGRTSWRWSSASRAVRSAPRMPFEAHGTGSAPVTPHPSSSTDRSTRGQDMSTENTTGGFAGAREAFTPPAAGSCCGSTLAAGIGEAGGAAGRTLRPRAVAAVRLLRTRPPRLSGPGAADDYRVAGTAAAVDAAAGPGGSAAAPGGAEQLAGAASADRMVATVHALAADRFAGRRVGTAGGQAAAQWLADRLTDLGATVTMDEFAVSGVRELQATPILSPSQPSAGPSTGLRRAAHLAGAADPGSGQLATADAPVVAWPLAARACRRPGNSWRAPRSKQAAGLLVPRGVDESGLDAEDDRRSGDRARPDLVGADRPARRTMTSRTWRDVAASVPMRTIRTTGPQRVRRVLGSSAWRLVRPAHCALRRSRRRSRAATACRSGDNASGVAVVLEAARLLAGDLPSGIRPGGGAARR